MKTIRFTAFSMLIGFFILVSSCKKETNPAAATQSGSKILVTGQDAGTGLKSTLNGQTTIWDSGSDKVGIYSAEARTESGGVTAIVNAPFTAATSAASSAFTGTMYWGTSTATPHTFYAYYPYKEGSAASTAVPVSLASAQTQSAADNSDHIGSLDFMVATLVTVTSPGNTGEVGSAVNLSYNHVFTVLEFQIKGSGNLTAVKLSGNSTLAFSGGTIDITLATPATGVAYAIASQSGTSNEAVVTLTSAATLNATTATTVYMVINPGTPTGNCLVEFLVNGAWTYIVKSVPIGGFVRGNKYVVAVDASPASTLVAGEVASLTGRIWMDRNLGASQVATASNDYLAYGSLYQWGRGTDGHQLINWTSSTGSDNAEQTKETPTLSTGDVPGHGNFITPDSNPYDWRSGQNVNLWQGTTGTNNNPCPSGFRLPTYVELDAERASWGSNNNSAGAFGSPLKFAVAGSRHFSGGSLDEVSSYGYYWSSTVDGTDSRFLYFSSSNAGMNSNVRAYGLSVRCIKN